MASELIIKKQIKNLKKKPIENAFKFFPRFRSPVPKHDADVKYHQIQPHQWKGRAPVYFPILAIKN